MARPATTSRAVPLRRGARDDSGGAGVSPTCGTLEDDGADLIRIFAFFRGSTRADPLAAWNATQTPAPGGRSEVPKSPTLRVYRHHPMWVKQSARAFWPRGPGRRGAWAVAPVAARRSV